MTICRLTEPRRDSGNASPTTVGEKGTARQVVDRQAIDIGGLPVLIAGVGTIAEQSAPRLEVGQIGERLGLCS